MTNVDEVTLVCSELNFKGLFTPIEIKTDIASGTVKHVITRQPTVQ